MKRTSLPSETIKLSDSSAARNIYQMLKHCNRSISVEDEMELLREYKNSDNDKVREEIRNKLVVNHQRFIFSTAKKYTKDAAIIEDLMSEGSLGLIESVDKFDETKGFTFLSYASWYINKNMSAYLKNVKNIVRDNSCIATKYAKTIKDIVESYTEKNSIPPTLTDIKIIAKEEYGINIRNTSDIVKAKFVYVDSPLTQDDNDKTFYESDEFINETCSTNNIESTIDVEDARTRILCALSTLNERDLEIVKMVFGLCEYEGMDLTEEMIAIKYNITKERVCQIRREAMRILKKKLSNK